MTQFTGAEGNGLVGSGGTGGGGAAAPVCRPGNPSECCTFFGVEQWFCLSMCVLCCMTCEIGTQQQFGAVGPPVDPTFPLASTPATHTNGQVPGVESLSFTLSSYGTVLPLLFGADKLTGNVFWNTTPELVSISSGGVTVQYWRISFALGLCEGIIDNILRMWIGERLIIDNTAYVDVNNVVIPSPSGFLLGMNLDLTEEGSPLRGLPADQRTTKISVFNGTESQVPQDIMLDKEGLGGAPGYRGTAYVLFENFVVIDGSLPNIFVEVTANSGDLIPRLYMVPPVTQVKFNDFTQGIHWDPGYNWLVVGSEDDGGLGTPANGRGVTVLDNATGDVLKEVEYWIGGALNGGAALNFAEVCVLYNGNILQYQASGNNGIIHTVNLSTGKVEDTLGPGGSTTAHSMTTGFGALTEGSFSFVGHGLQGSPVDIFCGVGTINRSIGFAQIDDNNQIAMVSVLNQVFAVGDTATRCQVIELAAGMQDTHPKFMDNLTSTRGVNIIVINGDPNEATAFNVYCICYNNSEEGATPTAPVFKTLGTITCDKIAGAGEGHELQAMFLDGQDYNLILVFNIDGDRDARIIKFNPFTGVVVWNTAVEWFTATNYNWSGTAILPGGQFCWISAPGTDLYKLDLRSGRYEILEDDLGSQALDAPTNIGAQFYNGVENSLCYLGTTASKQLTKIYVDRVSRSEVLVSDIVATLLARIGLDPTEINVEDLTALSLTGYTIKSITSLRGIFSELATVFRFDVIESEGRIKYKTRGTASAATIPAKYMADVDENGWLQEVQDSDFARRRKINLTYRDVAREYGTNVQSYALPKYTNETFDADASIDVTVPIVLDTTDAKVLAEILLYSKLVYESTYKFKLPARHLILEPGDVVTLQPSVGESILCRVREAVVGADSTTDITAVKEDNDIYNDLVALVGDIGRFNESAMPQVDVRIDPIFLTIPYINYNDVSGLTTQYAYFFYLLNRRNQTVYEGGVAVYVDGEKFSLTPPAGYPTWGYVQTPPVTTTSYWATDYRSTVRVELVSTAGLVMASVANKETLTNDSYKNLAIVGNELIQFQTATNVSGNIWDLTVIHRARFGTEGSISHTAGEKFVLLGDSAGTLDSNAMILGVPLGDSPLKTLQVIVETNNPFQPAPTKMIPALNNRPFSVSDAKASYVGNDGVITWQRRTRFPAEWLDDLIEEVELLEPTESYEMYLFSNYSSFTLTDPATYLRKVQTTTPTYTYTAANQTADGFDRLTQDLYILLYQTGSITGLDNGAGTMFRLEYKR